MTTFTIYYEHYRLAIMVFSSAQFQNPFHFRVPTPLNLGAARVRPSPGASHHFLLQLIFFTAIGKL
jgi:hypothetical protein